MPVNHSSAVDNIFSLLALYFYECMLTIGSEVKHVWTRKWTLFTWLYAINRYGTLINVIRAFTPTPTLLVRVVFVSTDYHFHPSRWSQRLVRSVFDVRTDTDTKQLCMASENRANLGHKSTFHQGW